MGNYVGGPRWASQRDMEIAGASIRAQAHGALAFSNSTRRWGYAFGAGSRPEAEAAALAQCQAGDTRIVLSGQNTYVALAQGQDNSFGWAAHANPTTASDQALGACSGPSPRIVAFFHAFSGPARVPPTPEERRRRSRSRAIVYACLAVVFGIGAVIDAVSGKTGTLWSPLVVAVIFVGLALKHAL